MSGERVCVTGSRTWSGEDECWRVHEELRLLRPRLVMHGGAKGADECADAWASIPGAGAEVLVFRANWSADGKAAGPIRNARMLREGRPDRGLAFGALWRYGGIWYRTGTGDMVRRMLDAGLPVRWVAAPDAVAVDLTEMPGPPGGER